VLKIKKKITTFPEKKKKTPAFLVLKLIKLNIFQLEVFF